jgi:hypothetical protein
MEPWSDELEGPQVSRETRGWTVPILYNFYIYYNIYKGLAPSEAPPRPSKRWNNFGEYRDISGHVEVKIFEIPCPEIPEMSRNYLDDRRLHA